MPVTVQGRGELRVELLQVGVETGGELRILGKAWAWISWIQGSSFLVGLGHILFQLRQL